MFTDSRTSFLLLLLKFSVGGCPFTFNALPPPSPPPCWQVGHSFLMYEAAASQARQSSVNFLNKKITCLLPIEILLASFRLFVASTNDASHRRQSPPIPPIYQPIPVQISNRYVRHLSPCCSFVSPIALSFLPSRSICNALLSRSRPAIPAIGATRSTSWLFQ